VGRTPTTTTCGSASRRIAWRPVLAFAGYRLWSFLAGPAPIVLDVAGTRHESSSRSGTCRGRRRCRISCALPGGPTRLLNLSCVMESGADRSRRVPVPIRFAFALGPQPELPRPRRVFDPPARATLTHHACGCALAASRGHSFRQCAAEHHGEPAAAPWLALDLIAPRGRGRCRSSRRAEAGAFADVLGREERIEDRSGPRSRCRGLVLDGDARDRVPARRPVGAVLDRGADPDVAGAVHRCKPFKIKFDSTCSSSATRRSTCAAAELEDDPRSYFCAVERSSSAVDPASALMSTAVRTMPPRCPKSSSCARSP